MGDQDDLMSFLMSTSSRMAAAPLMPAVQVGAGNAHEPSTPPPVGKPDFSTMRKASTTSLGSTPPRSGFLWTPGDRGLEYVGKALVPATPPSTCKKIKPSASFEAISKEIDTVAEQLDTQLKIDKEKKKTGTEGGPKKQDKKTPAVQATDGTAGARPSRSSGNKAPKQGTKASKQGTHVKEEKPKPAEEEEGGELPITGEEGEEEEQEVDSEVTPDATDKKEINVKKKPAHKRGLKDESPPRSLESLASMVASLTATRAQLKASAAKGKAGRPAGKKKTTATQDGKGKKPWKVTALRKGWLEFRAAYVKQNNKSGKSMKELNKEAGREWKTQPIRVDAMKGLSTTELKRRRWA